MVVVVIAIVSGTSDIHGIAARGDVFHILQYVECAGTVAVIVPSLAFSFIF